MWTIYKNKERIQKLKEIGDAQCIYQNKLDKSCFQHDLACEDFEDLTRRTASDKILPDKAFKIAKIPKDVGHQWGRASVVYKFFNKLTNVTRAWSETLPGSGIKNGNISSKKLAAKLQKLIIRRF